VKISTKDYLDYIRQQPHCCFCYTKGIVEPHHIKYIGMGRDRKKSLREHWSAVPVCRPCHSEYHSLGEKVYSTKHQINSYEIVYHYLSKYLQEKV
tara:strand:- start:2260 stop:2544 length:285 start_codon:yes stop_codon:yes gene_type:complete